MQALSIGREGGRERGRTRAGAGKASGVTTVTGKKKGKMIVPVEEEIEGGREEGVLREVGNSRSNRRKTILKLKKTTKVAAYVPEEDEEGREDGVEEEEGEEEDEALLKTDPVAYKEWIERVPPAGTKVVKGLSVGDCLR